MGWSAILAAGKKIVWGCVWMIVLVLINEIVGARREKRPRRQNAGRFTGPCSQAGLVYQILLRYAGNLMPCHVLVMLPAGHSGRGY